MSAAAALLLTLHATLAWLARDADVLTGGDDAIYVLLARALRGLSFREVWDVAHPVHHFYPPAYPALLAVWSALFAERFDALVWLSLIASTATLAVIFWVLRERFSPLVALLALAALSTNPYLIGHAGYLLSEPVYALVTVIPLALLLREDPTRGRLVLIGAIAIFAALTRSIGVTLLIAVALHWLIERRFAAVAMLSAASAATVGSWFAWVAHASGQAGTGSYFDEGATRTAAANPVLEVLGRVAENLRAYLVADLPWRVPLPTIPGTWIDNALSTPVAVLGLAFGIVVLFRRWRPAALYLLVYAALLAVWPWALGRFLVPVLPLIVPAVVLGFGVAVRPLGSRYREIGMAALTLVIVATGIAETAELVREKQGCDRRVRPPARLCLTGDQIEDQVSFFAALQHIDDNLPADVVVLTAKRAPLYYYTGRLTVPLEPVLRTPPAELMPHLRSAGVTYVLLSNLLSHEPGGLSASLLANCDELALVRAFPPRTYLFRLQSVELRDTTGAACSALAGYRRAVGGGGAANQIDG